MRTMGLALRQRERRNTATNINKENPNGGSTEPEGIQGLVSGSYTVKR